MDLCGGRETDAPLQVLPQGVTYVPGPKAILLKESSPVLGRDWEQSGSTGGWREGEDLLKEEA